MLIISYSLFITELNLCQGHKLKHEQSVKAVCAESNFDCENKMWFDCVGRGLVLLMTLAKQQFATLSFACLY